MVLRSARRTPPPSTVTRWLFCVSNANSPLPRSSTVLGGRGDSAAPPAGGIPAPVAVAVYIDRVAEHPGGPPRVIVGEAAGHRVVAKGGDGDPAVAGLRELKEAALFAAIADIEVPEATMKELARATASVWEGQTFFSPSSSPSPSCSARSSSPFVPSPSPLRSLSSGTQ